MWIAVASGLTAPGAQGGDRSLPGRPVAGLMPAFCMANAMTVRIRTHEG